jgi:hypothetical protein
VIKGFAERTLPAGSTGLFSKGKEKGKEKEKAHDNGLSELKRMP